jgi:trimeric autotransporter adhesin
MKAMIACAGKLKLALQKHQQQKSVVQQLRAEIAELQHHIAVIESAATGYLAEKSAVGTNTEHEQQQAVPAPAATSSTPTTATATTASTVRPANNDTPHNSSIAAAQHGQPLRRSTSNSSNISSRSSSSSSSSSNSVRATQQQQQLEDPASPSSSSSSSSEFKSVENSPHVQRDSAVKRLSAAAATTAATTADAVAGLRSSVQGLSLAAQQQSALQSGVSPAQRLATAKTELLSSNSPHSSRSSSRRGSDYAGNLRRRFSADTQPDTTAATAAITGVGKVSGRASLDSPTFRSCAVATNSGSGSDSDNAAHTRTSKLTSDESHGSVSGVRRAQQHTSSTATSSSRRRSRSSSGRSVYGASGLDASLERNRAVSCYMRYGSAV